MYVDSTDEDRGISEKRWTGYEARRGEEEEEWEERGGFHRILCVPLLKWTLELEY